MSQYTILSLNPSIFGATSGSVTCETLGLKIHGHYTGEYVTSVALDEHVCSFIVEQNKKCGLTSERRFVQVSEQWEKFENCFYAVAEENGDDNSSKSAAMKTVTVWEKYARPGRIYGETPRHRKIRLFLSLADESAPEPQTETPGPSKSQSNPSTTGIVSFDQVIDELKAKLARRLTAQTDQPVKADQGTDLKPVKVRRISQIQELDQRLVDHFPKLSPPKVVKTTVSAPSTTTTTVDLGEDVFSNYTVVHINPLWQGERDSFGHPLPQAPPPPSYDQLMKLSEKYERYNHTFDDFDNSSSWSVSSSSIAAEASEATEPLSENVESDDDESSSEEEYYQRVRRNVVTYLARPNHDAMAISSESSNIDEDEDHKSEINTNVFGHYSWPPLDFSHSFTNVFGDDAFTPLLTEDEQRAYQAADSFVVSAEHAENTPQENEDDFAANLLISYQKIVNDWRVSRGLPLTNDFHFESPPNLVDVNDDDSSSELSSSSSSEDSFYIRRRQWPRRVDH